jgi:hypothetical protein
VALQALNSIASTADSCLMLAVRRRHGDPTVSFVIFGVIIVAVIASYIIANIRQRKRSEAMQRIADGLGLTFIRQGGAELLERLYWCELFSRGRGKKITNLMRGSSAGRELAVFDYEYVTGSGKSRHVWRTTVACLRFDGPGLTHFVLRPEGTWDKISNWFRGSDIDFDTHPEFSRRFVLRGENEKGIRNLFTRDVLEFFERHPGTSAEGADQALLFYRHGKRISENEISTFLANSFELLTLIGAGSPVDARSV